MHENQFQSQDFLREDVKSVFNSFSKNNVDYIGYGRIDVQGQWTGYFSNDQWRKIYLEKNLCFYEPLALTLMQTSRPLLIWNLASLDDKHEIMKQRAEVCGINRGLTLQMRTEKGQEFLSLGFDSNHIDCIDFFMQHKSFISDQFKQLAAH